MFAYQLDDSVSIHFLTYNFSKPLFRLIDNNRAMLKLWFPWPDFTKTVDDSQNFIKRQLQAYTDNQILPIGVCYQGELVGMADLHAINLDQRSAEIGYWLAEQYQGLGIMSKAVKALISLGIEQYDLNVVRIAAEVDNQPSRAIAERLGFQYDGTLRACVIRDEQARDHAMYSILAKEVSW